MKTEAAIVWKAGARGDGAGSTPIPEVRFASSFSRPRSTSTCDSVCALRGVVFGDCRASAWALSDAGLGDALHTSRLAGWVIIACAGGNLIAVGLLSRGLRGGRLICLVFPVLAVFGGCAVGIDANG